MKMYLRQNKAITLIALVITIIVLLILAGVTIASLTGDNGLLSRAIGAKEESEKATIIEKARTEIMAKIAENIGKDITKKELTAEEVKDILDDYFNNVPNDITDQTQSITTKTNGYNVELSEVLDGVEIELDTTEYEISFSIDIKDASYAENIEVWSRRYFR